MLWAAFIFSFLFWCEIPLECNALTRRRDDHDAFGSRLVTQLRDDANLDLPVDEEYEDLRAELLAYHSALASLASGITGDARRKSLRRSMTRRQNNEPRRSMKQTACWQMGGVCINYKLCKGEQFLTEVPGCKNKLDVCCFSWNKYKVRHNDFHSIGISNAYYPWTQIKTKPFGGKGIVPIGIDEKKKMEEHKRKKEIKYANNIFFRDNPKMMEADDHYIDNDNTPSLDEVPEAMAVVLRHLF